MLKSGKILALCFLVVIGCNQTMLHAEMSRRTSTIIVFGDEGEVYLEIIRSYSSILDGRDRPEIVSGKSSPEIPDNATLVWFGDLAHSPEHLEDIPDVLKNAVRELELSILDRLTDLPQGEVRIGENCFTRHIDRPNGLPEVAVNFSEDDPQDFCKGLTIAYLLGGHGRWIRNDGTGCLWRDCSLMMFKGEGN